MGLVRAFAPMAGIEYAEINPSGGVWGANPGGTTFPEEWRGVPYLGETMEFKRDQLPKSKEFGEASSTVFQEYGKSYAIGQLIVQPRYNQQWFWGLIGQLMGTETVTTGVRIDGTVTSGLNRHAFYWGNVARYGFSLRVYDGGNTTGYIREYIGCQVSKLTWEQNQEDLPKITLDIVAKGYKTGGPFVISAAPSAIGKWRAGSVINPIYVKTRDLMQSFGTNSKMQTGATLTDLHITGFTLSIDRHLEQAPVFTTDMDNPSQPGQIESRDIDLEIRSLLTDDYLAANKPAREFADGTLTSKARIVYSSPTIAASATPYQIFMDMPLIRWMEARGPLNTPGEIPTIFKAKAIKGTFATPTGHANVLDDDFRILMHCTDADTGGTAANKFGAMGNA